ncbi:hypothetical protein CAEBREN_20659 [Caenorhabditis brenneri]|uniref:PAN-3 domain-containing protein n=1 Tax=Caenorhabditis brenneri TaxID=135651 RepID=G0NL85_CAEBE|nr:hypothetical protein CAEBREN_20659 [Caenorhabditis brenneri]
MFLYSFFLLFLLSSTVSSQYEATMVQMYGKVGDVDPSTASDKTLADENACTSTCYDDVECILAFMKGGYCLNYKYSAFDSTTGMTVTATTNTEGYVVAFKISQMACPKGSPTTFAYVDRRNDANYPFQWTSSGTSWTLTNPCPAPWNIIKRADGNYICMRTFGFGEKVQETFDTGIALCEEKGVKVTGISSQFELDTLVQTGNTAGVTGVVWVDGRPKSDCSSPCLQNSGYTWTDGYTTTLGDLTIKTISG